MRPSSFIACVTAATAATALLCAAPANAQSGRTALHAAVEQQDLNQLQALLAKPEGLRLLEARDTKGRTALLLATALGHEALATRLVAAGADVNAQDDQRDSPYLLAGARGNLPILRLTLAHGADLRSTNRYGGTALIPAAERGFVEAVRLLIAAGVEVNHVNRLGWTALIETVILSDGGAPHQDIARQLIAAGADVNLPDRDGVTPLVHAVQRNQQAMAALLLAAGGR
jgi:ankyrin repeat protein